MSEVSFTSSPWDMKKSGDGKCIRIGLGRIDGPNGYDIAEIDSDDITEESWPEIQANAHLIAAAPDLYEALESLIRITDDGFSLTPISVAIQLARAALSKARGETP